MPTEAPGAIQGPEPIPGITGAASVNQGQILGGTTSQLMRSGSGNPSQQDVGENRDSNTQNQCNDQESSSQDSPIAIIPASNITLAASQPLRLYWYIPEISGDYIEFVLHNGGSNDDVIYQARFRMPDKEGIVSVILDKDSVLLEPTRGYLWQLSIVCDSRDLTVDVDISTQGWLRLALLSENIQAQLDEASGPFERASIYANEGIWQDAISNLGQLRHHGPQNEQGMQSWQKFLRSVGLNNITNLPLLGELTPLPEEDTSDNFPGGGSVPSDSQPVGELTPLPEEDTSDNFPGGGSAPSENRPRGSYSPPPDFGTPPGSSSPRGGSAPSESRPRGSYSPPDFGTPLVALGLEVPDD